MLGYANLSDEVIDAIFGSVDELSEEAAQRAFRRVDDFAARGFDDDAIVRMMRGDAVSPSLLPDPNASPLGARTDVFDGTNQDPMSYDFLNPRRNELDLVYENTNAFALRRDYGYEVIQNPDEDILRGIGYGQAGIKEPDFIIEGEVFDQIAPSGSAWQAHERMRRKVGEGQADRIVLDMSRVDATWDEVIANLEYDYSDAPWQAIPGLQEVIAMKDGRIIGIWTP